MGAEATSSIGGVWARLEGQVVDDQFPLRRFLGSSEHSGVFLTDAPANQVPSEVALKLVSVSSSARAESQLARWYAVAAGVSHPHLVEMFDVGRCNVAGLGNLYAVMEYADQDLAQLLQRRALTEEETREMLVPVLSALAFLHERKLVMGRMKPSNVLVVGDRLKLASDAIRAVGEVDDVRTLSAYDPPEARDGSCSPAGDVWALGVTICEALTRRQPLGLMSTAGMVVLPPDLPPAFREIVGWCLRRQPQDRPEIAEVDAWLSGQPVEVVTEDSSAPFADEMTANELLEGEGAEIARAASGAAMSSMPTPSTPAPSAPAPADARTAGVDVAHASSEHVSVAPASAAPESSASVSTTPVDAELAAGLESPPSKAATMEPAAVVAPKAAPATPPLATPRSAASPPAIPPATPPSATLPLAIPPPATSPSATSATLAAAAASTAAPAGTRPVPVKEPAAPTSTPAPSRIAPAPESAKAAPTRAPEPPMAATNRAPPAVVLPANRAPAGASPPAPSHAPGAAASAPNGATPASDTSGRYRTPAAATSAPSRATPAAETSAPSRAPAAAAFAPSRAAPTAETSAPGRVPAAATSAPGRAAPAAETSAISRAPAAAASAPGRPASAAENSASARMPATAASAPNRGAPATETSAQGRAPAAAPSAPQRAPAAVTPLPTRAPPPAKPTVAPSKPAEPVSKWTPVESPTARERRRADADIDAAAPPPRRSLIVPALGVVVIIAVVWAGIRMFGTKPQSEAATDIVSETRPDSADAQQSAFPPDSTESAPTAQGAPRQGSSSASTGGKSAANPKASARATASGASPNSKFATPSASSVALQEVLPEIPQRSRRTIRGHVRVSVRLIVEQDGTVFAALAEQRGPSRYFERLAIDAAKKWTFIPADDPAQRLMLVKFDFTREGATAEAVPLK